MRDKMLEKNELLRAELNKTISEMGRIRQQIQLLNRQGEDLNIHVNVLRGQIEQNNEWLKHLE